MCSQRVAWGETFDNLVKYKELSIRFGAFKIKEHDLLKIKRINPNVKNVDVNYFSEI